MAFSDIVKTIFWAFLLLQVAPFFIKSIKQNYSDLFETKTKVAVIPIKGLIHNADPLLKDLKKYFEDPEIKAIVLKIDSPGGLSGTAQTIFQEINHYKTIYPSKYIVSIVENVAASGGYYIATASHWIIASPSAFIGSIGAYIQHPYLKEFIEQFKIKCTFIKAGTYKTAGNPLVEMTPEQRALFQTMTDEVYKQFVRDVARQRPHLPADSKEWADGRIFTGEQAAALKLIDEVGSPSTVERVLRENAPIVGKIEWVKSPRKLSLLAGLFGERANEEEGSSLSSWVNSVCQALEDRYGPSAHC